MISLAARAQRSPPSTIHWYKSIIHKIMKIIEMKLALLSQLNLSANLIYTYDIENNSKKIQNL